jgi:phosphatidylglycerophosphate synthase
VALDLVGSRPVLPGTQILIWCPSARDEPRVAGIPVWRRAIYTACRAGFARLLIVTSSRERLRAALDTDQRLEGRDWEVVEPAVWTAKVVAAGGRWVVLGEDWVVDEELLARLALTDGRSGAASPEGPIAVEAAELARWTSEGWNPGAEPIASLRQNVEKPSLCMRVRDEADARAAEDALFQGLARNVTNVFARYVDRAMSRAISRRLARFSITPNQITVFSTLLGIAGSLLLLEPSWLAGALGGFLFFAHTVIDGCDGEIARLKFQESPWGAKLDLIGDNVVHAFLFPCVALRSYFHEPDGPYLVLGAISLAGVVVTWVVVYWLLVRRTPSPAIVRVFELFANREFAYIVLILGIVDRFEWFVWAMAFGLWIFPIVLLAMWAGVRS